MPGLLQPGGEGGADQTSGSGDSDVHAWIIHTYDKSWTTTGRRRQRRASHPGTAVGGGRRALATGGPEAATSRAITERAGENLAAVTYWFGSKDALLAEAMIRQARSLIDPVIGELTGDTPPLERLLRAVQMLNSLFQQRQAELPAYLDCLATSARDDRVGAALRQLLGDLKARLAAEMAAQQAEGIIPAWVRPEPMAELIIAVVNGTAASAAVDPAGSDPAGVAAQFVGLLLASRPERGPALPAGFPWYPCWTATVSGGLHDHLLLSDPHALHAEVRSAVAATGPVTTPRRWSATGCWPSSTPAPMPASGPARPVTSPPASSSSIPTAGRRCTLHPKFGRWLQLGGHLEPSDTSLLAAAAREAAEESGLDGLVLVPGVIDIDIHTVPCPAPGGAHHDVRFLALAPAGAVERRSGTSRSTWPGSPTCREGADESVRRPVRAARAPAG